MGAGLAITHWEVLCGIAGTDLATPKLAVLGRITGAVLVVTHEQLAPGGSADTWLGNTKKKKDDGPRGTAGTGLNTSTATTPIATSTASTAFTQYN